MSAEEAVAERDVESGHCAVIRAGIRAEGRLNGTGLTRTA